MNISLNIEYNNYYVYFNKFIIIFMSYGWLTESSIIPKPSVPINVDNSSVNIK